MPSGWICFKNKNRGEGGRLDLAYLENMGASSSVFDERSLTGQGLGTKLSAGMLAVAGQRLIRSSHDKFGPYKAWYEKETYQIEGKDRERLVLVIERDDGEIERRKLTVDLNLFKNAWGRTPLGSSYVVFREPLLDAADEDSDFQVELCDQVSFSPEGETWTYIPFLSGLGEILKTKDYYFRKVNGNVTWLSDHVGYSDVSTVQETRLYITAMGASVAYVAWTNSPVKEDGTQDPGAEPAFDWFLREDSRTKFASLPDRIVKDVSTAHDAIENAIKKSDDPDFLAAIFKSIINGGWESELYFGSHNYGWRLGAVAQAFDKIRDGKPVHDIKDALYQESLFRRGQSCFLVGEKLYGLAKAAGVPTLAEAMNVRDKGEMLVRGMKGPEKSLYSIVLGNLRKKMPWVSMAGHQVVAIEHEDRLGVHLPDFGGRDTIGLNFELIGNDASMMTQTIIHELAHHNDGWDSSKHNYHNMSFIQAMERLVSPPLS